MYEDLSEPELRKTLANRDRQIKRLKKRLLEKQKYDLGNLMQQGATPQFIAKIKEKDQEALAD